MPKNKITDEELFSIKANSAKEVFDLILKKSKFKKPQSYKVLNKTTIAHLKENNSPIWIEKRQYKDGIFFSIIMPDCKGDYYNTFTEAVEVFLCKTVTTDYKYNILPPYNLW